MQNDFNVIVFISGRGSNLKSLVESAQHYKITHVLSNKPEAPGLSYARDCGISTCSRPRSDFSSVKEQKSWLFEQAATFRPNLIVLAGYMQIVEPEVVDSYEGKMINIHPSLLPAFPGLDTHKRALEAKVPEHGCSVHFVGHEVDGGPIIAQSKCQIDPQDNAHILASRVLELEHRLFPWVLNHIATGDIFIDSENTLVYSDTAQKEATLNDFILGTT